MPWTLDKALDDDLITFTHRHDALGYYEFRVGNLKTVVTVQVSRLPKSEEARYILSHAIKTPTQAGPYYQSRGYWDDVPYALHQAISSLTQYYREAVKAGHEPQESWLVESL